MSFLPYYRIFAAAAAAAGSSATSLTEVVVAGSRCGGDSSWSARTVAGSDRRACRCAFAAAAASGRNNNNKKSRKGGGGGGGKNKASTNKGFGTAPPTLDEVLASFQKKKKISRLPPDSSVADCPCGGVGRAGGVVPRPPAPTYQSCCEPFHLGHKRCLEPIDVLRTRYSAFSYRLIGYIMETTHPECRDYQEDRIAWAKSLNKDGMFDSYEFVQLQILDLDSIKGGGADDNDNNEEDGEDEGVAYIDFKVRLREREGVAAAGDDIYDDDDDKEKKETVVRERSKFLRDADTGTWSYAGGDVFSDVAGLDNVALN